MMSPWHAKPWKYWCKKIKSFAYWACSIMPYPPHGLWKNILSTLSFWIFRCRVSPAYTEYALDSYEVDAIDYLVKPIEPERFQKAVQKALSYHSLLMKEEKEAIETNVSSEYFFVKSERKYFKVNYTDILFIEGLKDYVILQLPEQRIITRMNMKGISELLPQDLFLRVNKSYIVNTRHIDSFDNNDIYIGNYEIAIGNSYRDTFFEEFLMKGKRKE